jgi:hypothetical protein
LTPCLRVNLPSEFDSMMTAKAAGGVNFQKWMRPVVDIFKLKKNADDVFVLE